MNNKYYKVINSNKLPLLISIFLIAINFVYAQPGPGDYYREYTWSTPDKKGNSSFLRVGGRFDYCKNPGDYKDLTIQGDKIFFNFDLDLEGALRAEVTVEKVLCHDGTKNLRIAFNGNSYYTFPDADSIPQPQENYMHIYYPSIEVSISDLIDGAGNSFSMLVDTAHHWNWPQNLIYGMILRIYYEVPASLERKGVNAKQINDSIIGLSLSGTEKFLKRVDYLGYYTGPDMNGDGVYRDWHYHYHRGKIVNHIGSSETGESFNYDWNVSWIPDQKESMKISARIIDEIGRIYFTEPVDIELKRRDYSVELCKPYEQPQFWVTRGGEHQERIAVHGDLSKLRAAKLLFTSWSPGYLNGIYLNDMLVLTREGDRYSFMQHDVDMDLTDWFYEGENVVRTGKTPLHHGNMVHGCEIMWPGIMFLLKYEE